MAYRGRCLLAVFWIALGAAATAAMALLIRLLIEGVFIGGEFSIVWLVGILSIVLFTTKGVASYFEQTLVGSVRIGVITDWQNRQLQAHLKTPAAFFDGQNPTKFAARSRHAANAIGAIISLVSLNFLSNSLTLIGLAAVMMFQDLFLFLAILIASPVCIVGLRTLSKRIKNVAGAEAELEAGVTTAMSEIIGGITIVKSYQIEKPMRARFNSVAQRMLGRRIEMTRLISLANPLLDFAGGFVIAGLLIYASWQSIYGDKDVGDYAAFITAFFLAYQPALQLASVNLELTRKLIPVERMYAFLDAQAQSAFPLPAASRIPDNWSIAFQKVSYKYRRRSPAVTKVSFQIEDGMHAALVGRSGAGKTTVSKLVIGHIQPDRGTITIGGVPLPEIAYGDLMAAIAIVPQDVVLFEGSILQNIQFGRMDASKDEILAAAEVARVTEFADSLENGLDMQIGSLGTLLSGGQRQRIALARAILKDSPIALLDEAASGIDSATDSEIIGRWRKSSPKTMLRITHRISSVQDCDLILVLESGSLVGAGTHKDLIESNAYYRSLAGEDSQLVEAGRLVAGNGSIESGPDTDQAD